MNKKEKKYESLIVDFEPMISKLGRRSIWEPEYLNQRLFRKPKEPAMID
jgi:hypothetical protein